MSDEEQSADPIADLLLHHSFPALAAAVRAQTDAIISEWEKAVLQVMPDEKRLSETQLRDHLPQILKLLGDVLAEDDPAETRKLLASPSQHGSIRFDQNYDAGQFITEYRLLRRFIAEHASAAMGRELSIREKVALDMGVDDLLQRGVVKFLSHQEARLRSSAEAEKKYLSFLSHDLRNNLNAVTLDLEVLKLRLRQSPDFAEAATELESTQHSIFETIEGMDRLLQAERLRKRAQPKIVPVDLQTLALEVAHHFKHRAAKKGIQISVEVQPGTLLHSDRECLVLVLQNLLGNAVKYSSKGTVRVGSICGQEQYDGTRWVLSVSDEGPGIAKENLSRIFEAFGRGETHGQSGVGLGLSVASEAAKMLGGELTVQSELGVGSTFCLICPAVDASGHRGAGGAPVS